MILGIIVGCILSFTMMLIAANILTNKNTRRVIKNRCPYCNEGAMIAIVTDDKVLYYQCDECNSAHKRTCPHCSTGSLELINAVEPITPEHWQCSQCDSTISKDEVYDKMEKT